MQGVAASHPSNLAHGYRDQHPDQDMADVHLHACLQLHSTCSNDTLGQEHWPKGPSRADLLEWLACGGCVLTHAGHVGQLSGSSNHRTGHRVDRLHNDVLAVDERPVWQTLDDCGSKDTTGTHVESVACWHKLTGAWSGQPSL